MNKNQSAAVALMVASLGLLAGCSAPTPTAAASPKTPVTACEAVASADAGASAALQTRVAWEGLRGQFDSAALKTTGDVKSRIEALVTEWPDFADVGPFGNLDAVAKFNRGLNDIGRACAAAGASVTMSTLPTHY